MHVHQCKKHNEYVNLLGIIAEYNPDVIGITESWATEKDIQGVLQLESYTCYRRDRMSKYSTKFNVYERHIWS